MDSRLMPVISLCTFMSHQALLQKCLVQGRPFPTSLRRVLAQKLSAFAMLIFSGMVDLCSKFISFLYFAHPKVREFSTAA